MSDVIADNANRITAPYAGWITMLTTSTVATYQDLQVCGPQAFTNTPNLVDMLVNESAPTGCVGRYVRFEAITSTLGLLFSNSTLNVTGSYAPSLTATGVNANGVCVQVTPGNYVDYWISPSTRYVGFVASGTGNIIISPTSRGVQG